MALETTAENLNTLVAEIIKDGANVSALLADFDKANNSDASLIQEKLFDDGEKSVNKFREELFGKKAVPTTTNFFALLSSVVGLETVNPSPLEIKKKVGFEKDESNPWIKKVDYTQLTKEKAQKFFYQRLLLSSFKDEDIFVTTADFHDDVHPIEMVNQNEGAAYYHEEFVEVEKGTIEDLWLYAKFNELKEEKEIPENYEYKAFVGLVRKSIEAAAKNPPETVTTKTIVDAVAKNVLEQKAATTIQRIFRGNAVAKNVLEQKAATTIQRIFRGNIGQKKGDKDSFVEELINGEMGEVKDKINDAIKIKDGDGKDTGLKNIKLLKQILEERTKKRNPKIPEPAGGGANTNNAPGGGNSAAGNDNSAVTEEMRKILEEMKKTLGGAKSSDPNQSEWLERNVTYQYLVDNNYVSNGENHYLIPEIKGREPGAVTQYNTGLPVFNYKDLNEFSQDAAEAGKGEWNADDKRLLSSIACIGEGENKRYCVVTSSVRGVTKAFISQTEFQNIIDNGNKFISWGLEAAIKTTALDETLSILNSAKERCKNASPKEEDKIKIIDDEIAAIGVRRTLMTESDDYSVEERLSRLDLYNNLDIALPEGIDFTKEEKTRFEAAKSRTVVADDSYNTALEVVLKMDAADEIYQTLEEAKTRYENEKKDLEEKQKNLNPTNPTDNPAQTTLMIALKGHAIKQLEEAIKSFNKPDDAVATFQDKQKWSLTDAFKELDKLLSEDKGFLDEEEKRRIKESADKAINDKDKPQEIIKKLISADVEQIDYAQELADKEFGIKTGNRKEKLEKASDKEKESARHSASCSYSHEMAKSVERSIEDEVINGLDTFEVKSMAEDMANAHAKKAYIYGSEDKEAYAKNVRKLLKAPVPHTNVNGVGFHRPRGTNIVSVAFNYSGVGTDGDLTEGNTEAYPYIDGSFHCYVGCRVCKKDGMMTVWENGKAVAKEHKRGDTVIDQNTISFLDPKTQTYTHVEASTSALKAHLELMKKNGSPYPGSVETIMAQYEKMQIKVTSQVNNATLAEEPDIERKVSIMHKGKTLSYNADNPQTTIGKKKVVKEAFDIDSAGKIAVLRPGFSIDSDSKVEDGQHQFIEMNIIKLPDGTDITPYVKLSTNTEGKVIHESEPYVIVQDDSGVMKFEKLTPNSIAKELRSGSNIDDDDIKDEAAKLFGRTVNDCRNTKLILPLGIAGEAEGKKYEISTPTDFAGVGRGDIDNKPSPIFPFRGKETKSKAIKLGDVNKLKTVPEVGIGQRVNQRVTVR